MAIGTSGMVYPAAAFVSMARANGRNCVSYEVNPKPTGGGFTHIIAKPATAGVPELAARLTA